MSKVKKILAVVLSMAMVLSMSLTAFAADAVVGNSDDVGTITVSGIDAEDNTNLAVTAYPIARAGYDVTTGNFTGYTNPYNLADITEPTLDELNAILATSPTNGLTLSKSGTNWTRVDVPVGMYLVSVTGAETKVYNPAVVSVSYLNAQGQNVINQGAVTMVQNGAAWVKKSGVPTVDKVIVDAGKGNSVDIGDPVQYEATIKPIPNYLGEHPTLNVVDTLSDGLDYKANSLAVKVGTKTLVENVDYTLSVNGRVITVNFVVNDAYTLNEYATNTTNSVVIIYEATLNKDAALNEDANENNIVLNYSKDSKQDGADDTDESKTYTYTFDIDGTVTGTTGIITKIGEDTDSEYLDGAVFGLYKDATATTLYDNDAENADGTDFDFGAITSANNGQLHVTGLAAGTYYLKEISAPAGYSVNTHIFKVEIAADFYKEGDTGVAEDQVGMLKTWSVTIDDTETASFAVNLQGVSEGIITGTDIANTKLSSLPSTGGIGTTIFTIGGVIIMIGAAFLFFRSRKKEA